VLIDSSALLAIYLREPRHEACFEKISKAAIVVIGAPTLLEVTMVLSARTKRDVRGEIARSLRQLRIQVISFTEEHFDVAADAFLRYGKGRHPAALDFGACMSYAVAALSGLPLLYTGSNNFAQTDIRSA
jgi:ribonuclease VapC